MNRQKCREKRIDVTVLVDVLLCDRLLWQTKTSHTVTSTKAKSCFSKADTGWRGPWAEHAALAEDPGSAPSSTLCDSQQQLQGSRCLLAWGHLHSCAHTYTQLQIIKINHLKDIKHYNSVVIKALKKKNLKPVNQLGIGTPWKDWTVRIIFFLSSFLLPSFPPSCPPSFFSSLKYN